MTPLDLLELQNSRALVQEKFSALRSLLREHNLDGYLIPSADEHLNEYLPEVKQRRTWMSGFTGSAGDLLVGQNNSWLFVDSRYHEQADLEVDVAVIQVSKLGLEGHKTLIETLELLGQKCSESGQGFRLGFDPFTISAEQFRLFQQRLAPTGVSFVPIAENLVDQVRSQAAWAESSAASDYGTSKVFCLSEQVTGEAIAQKLSRIREVLHSYKANILPVTKLDQIAWLFNLRGWDIPYNPVFIAYAVITPDAAFLFTNLNRMEPEVQESLPEVTLLPYEVYGDTLKGLVSQLPVARVLLDPKHTTMGTYGLLNQAAEADGSIRVQILELPNPIEGMKARKNLVEIAQMQAANLKASRAKTRTFKWMLDQLAQGQTLTELDVAHTIEKYYQEEADFQGLSFNTIAAASANSSIVHYGTPSAEVALRQGEFVLLDSGAQYWSGTTDDTRTFIVGTPTPEQIACYTAVLKAHINCAMQRFPKGTTGVQLDGIARSAMWMAGLDYGHGTGHGVGAFLNVHEGPNGISKRSQEPLEPGMVTSIEPGFYQPGWGGIRIENLYVVKDVSSEMQTQAINQTAWYGFESLTYVPFDKRLIDLNQLERKQREWLEHYHATVVAKLAPTLTPEEAAWLKDVCRLN